MLVLRYLPASVGACAHCAVYVCLVLIHEEIVTHYLEEQFDPSTKQSALESFTNSVRAHMHPFQHGARTHVLMLVCMLPSCSIHCRKGSVSDGNRYDRSAGRFDDHISRCVPLLAFMLCVHTHVIHTHHQHMLATAWT